MTCMKSLWLAVVCTCVLAGAAQSAVMISDAFAGHANGASLKGTVTDVGNATWNAGSSSGSGLTFATGDFVQSSVTNKVNWVPYAPAVGDICTVSVDVNLPASGKVDFGFDSANGSWPQAGSNAYNFLVYLEVQQSGAWILKYRNASGANGQTGVGSGNVGALTTGTFYTMALQWDLATKTANAWINGAPVVTGKVITNINANPVAYAGFGNNGSGTLKVDNFAVDVVPEPATLVLLVVSASWIVRRRC